ncbi:MAG: LptF/LptG family permease [Pseudanabaenaceae cyanobacterium]
MVPISVMDRYLTSQLGAPFLFGVGAFSSVILAIGSLFELVRLVAESGLNALVALQIFILQLPGFAVYSFPMSVLLAALLAYSRLSGDGEIIAMRSCGVSVYRLLLPAVVFSLLISFLTFAFNEAIVPAANWQARQALRSALNQENLRFQQRDIFYQQYGEIVGADGSSSYGLVRTFYARRFDGRVMRDVTVMDFSQGGLQQIMTAKSAEWLPQANVWQFRDGATYILNSNREYNSVLRFDQQNVQLSRAPLDIAEEQRNPEEMNISEITRKIELLKQAGNWQEVRKLEVRRQQKYALPFVCLVFVLIGCPLGMRPQRTGTALGFGLSVVIIFGYYLLLFICGALGQTEVLTPVLAGWLPNIICLGIGIFLVARIR